MKKTLWVLGGAALLVAIGFVIVILLPGPGTTAEPSWLLFTAQKGDKWDLFLIREDGKEEVNLTKGRGLVGRGLFSPDGKQIVFDANFGEGWRIYTMSSDGSNINRLTDSSAGYSYHRFPTMSPDGTVAFQCTNAGSGAVINICSVSPDGNNLTLLAEKSLYPYFSPDGKRIVFQSNRDGNTEIYVMNADGSDQRRLTDNPAIDSIPQFSPDGSEIIFESSREAPKEYPKSGKIFVMNAAGTNVRRLSNLPREGQMETCKFKPGFVGDDLKPAFSSDGKRFAFTGIGVRRNPAMGSAPCSYFEVFVSDLNGTVRQVTDKSSNAKVSFPSFAPAGFRR